MSPSTHHAVAACASRTNPADVLTCLAAAGVKLTKRDAPLADCLMASHDASAMISCVRKAG